MKYGVFSDESRHTQGRYRCIAAVSLPADRVVALEEKLNAIISAADVPEIKWRTLRAPKTIKCASAILDVVLERVAAGEMRIDAVIWDVEDSRHSVERRDDIRNYERMFFHLHRRIMARREGGAQWHLRPDEQVCIDWQTLQCCLSANGTWRKEAEHPVLSQEFASLMPRLGTLKQVRSHEHPLCQAADLFAGMAPYTREKAHVIRQLLGEHAGQTAIVRCPADATPSGRDRRRFPLIVKVYDFCKRNRLGVSLGSNGYLATRDPRKPINFWHYVPQHHKDKAPVQDA